MFDVSVLAAACEPAGRIISLQKRHTEKRVPESRSLMKMGDDSWRATRRQIVEICKISSNIIRCAYLGLKWMNRKLDCRSKIDNIVELIIIFRLREIENIL